MPRKLQHASGRSKATTPNCTVCCQARRPAGVHLSIIDAQNQGRDGGRIRSWIASVHSIHNSQRTAELPGAHTGWPALLYGFRFAPVQCCRSVCTRCPREKPLWVKLTPFFNAQLGRFVSSCGILEATIPADSVQANWNLLVDLHLLYSNM